MENVQKRACNMIKELEQLPYEKRWQQLGLFRLNKKRSEGWGMTEVYKIMHGVENVVKFSLIIPELTGLSNKAK